ncbi:MAG TPA: YeeE/YedE family protein [Thermoanaerobaculaceae bacterium]|nr:YeeE/YedE family protein [Thermoanaerobaculaceae bacterium]HRS16419.1 YeeE/YedE family protein [Thermoanaerobaculaceae bacterium]
MTRAVPPRTWRWLAGGAFLLLAAVTAVAWRWQLWALSALPVGFLFGFFVHKGGVCGAAAASEVLVLREGARLWAIWVAIVTAMVAFAALDLLQLVKLSPKPMIWASYLVGGLVFGVGMVLAGGCVSGCLFKTGAGNLNSMAGLIGIPLGVAMVESGPLKRAAGWLGAHVLRTPDGGPVTLGALSGLPFWAITAVLVTCTAAAAAVWRRRHPPRRDGPAPRTGWLERALTASWRPWAAGLAIGLLAGPAYLSAAASGRNYPIGVTHGVYHWLVVLTANPVQGEWRAVPAPRVASSAAAPADPAPTTAPAPPARKVSWWLVLVAAGLVAGSHVSARLEGSFKLLPKPPEQVITAFGGGMLVGIGAGLASGCVVGNVLSGWALQSVGVMLFGVVTLLSAWVTTWVYLMGGLVRGR